MVRIGVRVRVGVSVRVGVGIRVKNRFSKKRLPGTGTLLVFGLCREKSWGTSDIGFPKPIKKCFDYISPATPPSWWRGDI